MKARNMTLDDYSRLILQPMHLDCIERGLFDSILNSLEEDYKNDEITMEAINQRRNLLMQQNFNQEEI